MSPNYKTQVPNIEVDQETLASVCCLLLQSLEHKVFWMQRLFPFYSLLYPILKFFLNVYF